MLGEQQGERRVGALDVDENEATLDDIPIEKGDTENGDEQPVVPREQSTATGTTSNGKDELSYEHEHWTSRWSFILAAIGSAIGLGNFWRFPNLAYRWGGGAFFIPYLLALFIVGVPLLQLEFALGQVLRRAATQSFGRLAKGWAGVGLAGAVIALGIVGYYCAILGWNNVLFIKSWQKDMAWSIRGATGDDVLSIPNNHFYNDLLHLSADPGVTEIMASYVFAGAFFQWICVFVILYKGSEFISKAVWITVLLPVFTLIVLIIVGLTLPGAGDGIKEYIGKWDMSQLSEGQMWVDAFTQIFFSLSLATGVMSAYASMNPRNQNVIQDALIVAVANSVFSFFSGFAVFAVIGYMSHESGISIEELQAQGLLGGPSLAFIAYPSGLSLVDGYGANILTIIFTITFFFLGIDSAFSLVESVILNFRETPFFFQFSREQLVIFFCLMGACTTFLYTADIGLYLLDVADRYISTFGLNLVGFFEVFIAGWVYKKQTAADELGMLPVLLFDGGVWLGFALFTALSLGLPYEGSMSQGTTLGIAFGVGLAVIVFGAGAGLALGSRKSGLRDAAFYLCWHGPDELRQRLNKTICSGGGGAENNWQLRDVWVLLLKWVMPPILFFLLAINVEQLSADKGYGGYGPGYQAFGTILLLMVFATCIGGFVVPKAFRDPHQQQLEKSSTATDL